jgi:hypothetical protein
MSTNMELTKTIQEVKKGIIPEDIKLNYPEISILILRMVK